MGDDELKKQIEDLLLAYVQFLTLSEASEALLRLFKEAEVKRR